MAGYRAIHPSIIIEDTPEWYYHCPRFLWSLVFTMRTLNTELISAFRHSAPYITMHRGQTFVFLLSAETIADRHIDSVISDIAILQSLGIKLVIVFGCKNQIDNALADAKVKTRFYKRIRIADTRSFSIIKRVCGDIQ